MPKTTIATLALLATLALAACGGSGSTTSSHGSRLSLAAYSTPKEAYQKLIPAFERTTAGKGVSFTQSYGGSGSQARAVASGLPADVVALSLAPDVQTLVDAGIVAPSWDSGSHGGIVTRSVVVFVVRKGNPKHTHTPGPTSSSPASR